MSDEHVLKMLRSLPLASVRVRDDAPLGSPALQRVTVVGTVGSAELELELLCSEAATAGSWYFAEPIEPPRKWLGRCYAGRS